VTSPASGGIVGSPRIPRLHANDGNAVTKFEAPLALNPGSGRAMSFFDVLRREKVPRMNELRELLRAAPAITLAAALGTWGCSSESAKTASNDAGQTEGPSPNDDGTKATPGFSDKAVDELKAANVDKYLGQASLSDTTTNSDGDTVYNFDPSGAAVCYLGDPYHVITHDAGSDNLLIFLQGGGACWETLCQATATAGTAILKSGLLGRDKSTNVVGDWNVVYAPYCDGSVFSGDNDMMSPDGKTMWKFHGLANLSAVVDVAKKAFPDPKRILLAGTSGGGYGTLTGTGVTRLAYPHTRIDVFNDAGLGLSNPSDPNMLATVKRDWKFEQFIPESCEECKTGVETAVIGWGLGADPSLRIAGFSSYGDGVIGGVFLGLQPADFKPLLVSETNKVHAQFPKRFERFFIDGSQHTVLLTPGGGAGVGYDTKVEGVSVEEWLEKMLDGDPSWTDHMQGMDGG
jgi:hypothetical protein